jgi:hypothetical protein
MKNKKGNAVFFILLITAIFLSLILAARSQTVISDKDKSSLIYFREEQKLAADAFASYFEIWENKLFFNAEVNEKGHIKKVISLLEYYEIEDPAGDNEKGKFINDSIKNEYFNIVSFGRQSLIHAYLGSAELAEKDIFETGNAISETDNEKIIEVYKALKGSSEKYLKIFIGKLKDNSVVYRPKYLKEEDFNKIVNTISQN